jgi:ATP-binding cassette subfamily F protein 3
MKMLDRLETVEVDGDLAAVSITIMPVETRQGAAVRIMDLGIGYPEKTIAKGITFEIDRGRHVAVVGDNGQGKTTFLGTIAGNLPPKSGEMRWGHGIVVGTYAQHVFTAMDPSVTVQRYLEKAAASAGGPMTPTQRILDMAGSFLFRGSDVEKKIAVLSGGERARLCLAGLLLSRCTVMLLDEPTNHLDFETVEALADALKTYDGTIFFTSHDRTFVSRVATDIVEVNNGKVELYGDDYAGYVYRIERETRDETDGPTSASTAVAAPAAQKKALSASDRKAQHEQVRNLRNQLKQVEKKVALLDAEKKKLSAILEANPTTYQPDIIAELDKVTAELDTQEGRWLELNDEIENNSVQD